MSKIVTICGSMKFKEKMMEVSKDLEIKNKYLVIQCIYSNEGFNEAEQQTLSDLHYNKIEISDAIYVVNVDGYIGNQTQKEIEFAKNLGKEVMYLESIKELKKEVKIMKKENNQEVFHKTSINWYPRPYGKN